MLFGCDFFFNFENATGRKQPVCRGMAKHYLPGNFSFLCLLKKKPHHLSRDTRAVSHTGRSLEAAIAPSCPRAGQALKQAQVATDKV